MKESNLQKNCIKFCKSEGIYHIAIRAAQGSKDIPNLIICLDGKFVAFDCREYENILPEQRLHQKKIQSSRGLYYRPRSLEDFVQIIRSLQD